MDDFMRGQGTGFFGYILWKLHDRIVRSYVEWQPEIGFVAPPRTHSTIRAIYERQPISVTEVAALIDQSHPLVINWIRQLKQLGLVDTTTDPKDRRRTILRLTEAGMEDARRHEAVRDIISRALDELMREADAQVYEALWRLDDACKAEPFLERLRRAAAARAES